MVQEYIVYTDGACKGTKVGGWGVKVCWGNSSVERYGAERDTTNNRMELTAAIEGLIAVPEGASLTLISDSKYVILGASQWIYGWKRNGWRTSERGRPPVKNADLWRALDALASSRNVKWQWVRGHDGNPGNERCDVLANEAIAALDPS